MSWEAPTRNCREEKKPLKVQSWKLLPFAAKSETISRILMIVGVTRACRGLWLEANFPLPRFELASCADSAWCIFFHQIQLFSSGAVSGKGALSLVQQDWCLYISLRNLGTFLIEMKLQVLLPVLRIALWFTFLFVFLLQILPNFNHLGWNILGGRERKEDHISSLWCFPKNLSYSVLSEKNLPRKHCTCSYQSVLCTSSFGPHSLDQAPQVEGVVLSRRFAPQKKK